MNIDDLNNNILSNRWKERYDKLSDEIKEKLNELDNSNISDYQLQVIKRKRLYPEIGDIFKVNPRDDIYFYGVVLNNHIHNINGDDLLLVLIFKQNIDIKGSIINGVKEDDLLLPPQIVGKEYWTRGFFYNVEHYDEILNVKNYGFYSIGKGEFVDEYGKELANQPKLLGTYGVATISGIARKINQELIIRKII
ncbi:Imm26 family immunity protein [Mediterraneibacter gnavus]|jgi:hypothetical protein|uniref:Imm26 family immunity protein n=1 Tax=Mediterraneibacter gnavus TaxID=33038 RepID=A0A9X3KAG3_MEDGN|nr:Imm26 family immunity protein [Mediterraneibacter gnavus]MCZ7695273.1 Imm26 family immunity protein [Mediterraneibacter gnavus]MCZ7736834.1 Imm26 family immunity protein [Mediterraneibacter gnavus]MDC6148479.1 Imm26 family immunity protein [Mediterraneibacter gnavus]MDE1201896.1 Imm26 family immunity protein [Mediterraneibacter gnavus]